MPWYDRAMIGALVAVMATLIVLGVNLVARVEATAEVPRYDIEHVPATVTPATLPPGWSRCYDDEGTERWVPNLPVPAVGECT